MIMPSHSEGFCLAAAEGMAADLPVLASAGAVYLSGLGDLVIENRTGITFQTYDPTELIYKTQALISNLRDLKGKPRAHILGLVDNPMHSRAF